MWKKRGVYNSIKELFLSNMGVDSTDEVNEWFKKHYNHQYRIDLLNEAVEMTRQYKDRNILIVGDYDADGITSTSILVLALRWAGFKNVSYRIPKRFSEGFGINENIIDEADNGLIITCDNGFAQTDVISKAKNKGLKVIILDHHLAEVDNGLQVISPADIAIDPSAMPHTADFDGYCGAGLCYKFAEILLDYDKTMLSKLMSLAAIGTVADVMKLRSENYVIVRNGMKCMVNYNTSMPGLYAILNKANLISHITAKDIGFKIGPVINAASRMNDTGANGVIEILTFEGPYEEILESVDHLFAVNDLRKDLENEALIKAEEVIEGEWDKKAPLIITLRDTHEGILGIIAGKLAEKYSVPAVVLTNIEGGRLKGSARTFGDYDIKEHFDEASNTLLVYGGHKEAGGLTLLEKNYDAFVSIMHEKSSDFVSEVNNDTYYDFEISASEVPDMIKELSKYEPFGEGNPLPVFKVKDFTTIEKWGEFKKIMGKNKDSVKVFSRYADAVGIGQAEKLKYFTSGNLSFIGTLSDNYYNNNVTHQIMFTDVQ